MMMIHYTFTESQNPILSEVRGPLETVLCTTGGCITGAVAVMVLCG